MSELIGESVRGVLFDHDDTLVKTIEAKSALHKYVAQTHYDKVLTDEEIRTHWGTPLRQFVCQVYGTTDVVQALEYCKAYQDEYPKELFEATMPTLKHLKAAGKIIGIVTSTARYSFEHDLITHQFPADLLDYTQTSDDTPFHKPDPRVFEPALAWLDQQHIKPDDVVYVGDGLLDFQAATGAGFNFIGVETGLVTAEQFSDLHAVSVPSIANLV